MLPPTRYKTKGANNTVHIFKPNYKLYVPSLIYEGSIQNLSSGKKNDEKMDDKKPETKMENGTEVEDKKQEILEREGEALDKELTTPKPKKSRLRKKKKN